MPSNNACITLPRPLVNTILRHAQQHPDVEVCGLVGRDDRGRMRYYPVANIARQPQRAFRMDAPEQIQAMKQMREQGQQLFAIVHSHPSADARPSQRDIEENGYPEACSIIVSLNTKGVLDMRAFRLQDGQMREVEMVLET